MGATSEVLAGRVALVTGGGRGIGRAIAEGLAGLGARVAVLARSADEVDETVAELGLTFPVGHGADAQAVAAATGFVLDPAGRVVVSVCSSGAIGRLVSDDVVGLIRFVREHAAS